MLAAWLEEAREFLSEWRELRGVHQSRLAGRVLRAPLDQGGEGTRAGLQGVAFNCVRMACINVLLPHALHTICAAFLLLVAEVDPPKLQTAANGALPEAMMAELT